MRIHDIAVVADPNRRLHDEPEPEVADGSYNGRVGLNSQLPIDIEGLQTAVTDHAIWYWTGPWPILNVVINWQPILDALIKLHFGFDLLPPFVHLFTEDSEMRCFAAMSAELGISEENEPATYAAAAELVKGVLEAPWFEIATVVRLTMTILGWISPGNPTLTTAFYAASVIYAAAMVMAVIQTLVWIVDGTIGVLEGVLSLWWMGWYQIIPFGLIGPAVSVWLVSRELATFEAHAGLVSNHRLLQLNAKAGMSLFSLWLTLIMGAYMIGSALLIAAACSHA
jgi:hypothetical protein